MQRVRSSCSHCFSPESSDLIPFGSYKPNIDRVKLHQFWLMDVTIGRVSCHSRCPRVKKTIN